MQLDAMSSQKYMMLKNIPEALCMRLQIKKPLMEPSQIISHLEERKRDGLTTGCIKFVVYCLWIPLRQAIKTVITGNQIIVQCLKMSNTQYFVASKLFYTSG